MLLQGLVLSGDVLESTFYDQSTGQPKPGYSVKLTVLDAETDEKYECQVSEGFPSQDDARHPGSAAYQGQRLLSHSRLSLCQRDGGGVVLIRIQEDA